MLLFACTHVSTCLVPFHALRGLQNGVQHSALYRRRGNQNIGGAGLCPRASQIKARPQHVCDGLLLAWRHELQQPRALPACVAELTPALRPLLLLLLPSRLFVLRKMPTCANREGQNAARSCLDSWSPCWRAYWHPVREGVTG